MKIIGYTRNDKSVFEVCRKTNGKVIEKEILDRPIWVTAVNLDGPGTFDLAYVTHRRRDGKAVREIATAQFPMRILDSPYKIKRQFLDRGIWTDPAPAVIRYLLATIIEIEGGLQNENN